MKGQQTTLEKKMFAKNSRKKNNNVPLYIQSSEKAPWKNKVQTLNGKLMNRLFI